MNGAAAGRPVHVTCQGERFRLYLTREEIEDRVRAMAEELSARFGARRPIFIGVLNGSFIFLADLMRAMSVDCEVDFLKLSSYGAGKVTSGQVYELKKIDARIEGRDVIVVEDIVDTGLSMVYILGRLREHKPASLTSVTLLRKPDAAQVEVEPDLIGFDIPDAFVIGYGLDYGQLARNLPDIYILDDAGR